MSFSRALCSALLFGASTAAQANGVPPMPLDRQLAEADLVVVGSFGPETICRENERPFRCAEIVTETTLKGPVRISLARRYLRLSSPAHELSLGSPIAGERLLLFLNGPRGESLSPAGRRGEVFTPVRWRRSVVALHPWTMADTQRALCPRQRSNPPAGPAIAILAC